MRTWKKCFRRELCTPTKLGLCDILQVALAWEIAKSLAELEKEECGMLGILALTKVYKGVKALTGCNILYAKPMTTTAAAEIKLCASLDASVVVFTPSVDDLHERKIALALANYSPLRNKISLLGPRPTTPRGLLRRLYDLFFKKERFRPHIIVDDEGKVYTAIEGEHRKELLVSSYEWMSFRYPYPCWGGMRTYKT